MIIILRSFWLISQVELTVKLSKLNLHTSTHENKGDNYMIEI